WEGRIEKVDDYRWQIPRKEGMRVPGLIYSTSEMLEHIRLDKTPQQVANVAHLPGIVAKSMAMPDIHWGYGFCIGGVAATDVERGGVISPGGVGYDINCLSSDAEILHSFGYRVKIKDFEKIWEKEEIKNFDFNKSVIQNTKIIRFLKQYSKTDVYKIKNSSGKEIIATKDHPFYTKDGMIKLEKLQKGDKVAIYPFEGVYYQKPCDDILISEEDIKKLLLRLEKTTRGNATIQILNQLKKRNLLPLRINSPQVPYLLKIMGYLFGDGNIFFVRKKGKGITSFYGKEEDLEEIRTDIAKIGYICSRVYKRDRNHTIHTHYKTYKFSTQEISCMVRSSSLAILLLALGVPLGNKAKQDYQIPQWIYKCPLWYKRLFLATFFGAEMSSPGDITGNKYNLYCPIVSLNKREEFTESCEEFLGQLQVLLEEFGVKTQKISKRIESINKKRDKSCRLRLIIGGTTENLIALYSKIGFEYNRKRQFLANVAIHFLGYKQIIIKKRLEVIKQAKSMREALNCSAKEIYQKLGTSSKHINFRFIQRTIYEGRKTEPRIAFNSQGFKDFLKEATEGLEESGMVWDEIQSIQEIEYRDYVYDFTVEHSHHNFIANNFVVSNCGIRLLKTNLTKKDIQDKLSALISSLYINIPSGVGSTGRIHLSKHEVRQVLEKGSGWAVGKGYGLKEDLDHTEENGCLKKASSDNLSKRAIERGIQQLGTLGSGNHFLEIQEVEEIYDTAIADRLGLSLGQITVMIHTGSRGLGYQVCDDSLRVMQDAVKKYSIDLPDKQLACAPIDSPEGENYFSAMCAAANYAWANRQCIMHWTRETFEEVLRIAPRDLGMRLIYDVAHNIAKIEEHLVEGKKKKLCVHRKGATRAFAPNHPDLPDDYQKIGQPVIIPGTMGTYSYVLVGTQKAMEETWGITCHGSGRVMSRHEALRRVKGNELKDELKKKNILVKAKNFKTLAEEAPSAYKDVNSVVDVCDKAGISKKVARLKPLAVIKG
ncbi:MAG: intein-containing RctB family protein, partial [Nanoarchaeota archaeon]|nr:intein-containing RctB family protein [Nanoarchaeota archaeon]